MALRSTNGSGVSLYDLWSSSDSRNTTNCDLWSVDPAVPGVFKSEVTDTHWDNISEVSFIINPTHVIDAFFTTVSTRFEPFPYVDMI